MGCSICAKFGSKTKFGRSLVTSLKRSVIDLHAGSPAHLSCSETRQKKTHVPDGEAPSTEYFRKLIAEVVSLMCCAHSVVFISNTLVVSVD